MKNDYASMTTADFAAKYEALSDDALTQIAADGGLRPEAEIAMQAEMRKRSIGAGQIQTLRTEQEQTKLQMRVGHNPYSSYRGVGLQLRSSKFLNEADKREGITVVTRWIVFAFMPLIPLGSYRVKYARDDSDPTIVGEIPLQWDQVFAGWKRAAMTVLLFVGFILALMIWDVLRK